MRVAGNPGVVGIPVVRALSRVPNMDCMSRASFVEVTHRCMRGAQVAWIACTVTSAGGACVSSHVRAVPLAVTA
ncbi:MAG: hypothetical protein RL760_1604 [Candidatus Eisenbacteria bacterium]|jgi:hypothetical protein